MIDASGRRPDSEVEDHMPTEGAPHPMRLPDK